MGHPILFLVQSFESNSKCIRILLYVSSVLMYSGLIYSNKPVNAENVDRFWCVLDGNQEMPPVSVETKKLPQGEIKGDEFIPIDRIIPDISDFQWN
jgi:hypothetical protein